MKRIGIIAFSSGLALAALVACADSNDGNPPSTPDDDGGTLPPGPDADPPIDAGNDAADAADAAPRECSKDGFCPTAVPGEPTLLGVWSDSAGVAWAVSEQGKVLRYNGTAWTVTATLTGALRSIWGSGPTDIWVGGDDGLFHGTGASSEALTFEPVSAPGPTTPISSVWGTGKDDVWATGGVNGFPLVGRLLHFAPGKAGPSEWSLVEATPEPIWYHRTFGNAVNGVWAIGTYNNRTTFNREMWLLHRAPGATDFVREELPLDPDLSGNAATLREIYDTATSPDGKTVWVVGRTNGSKMVLLTATSSDNVTYTWKFEITSAFRDPRYKAVSGTGPNDVWLIGEFGRIKHNDGSGSGWRQSLITVDKYPVTNVFYATFGQGDGAWFVGEDIALRRDLSKVQQ